MLVAAPLLLTIGDVLQLARPGSIGWTVVLTLAFACFVPAAFAMAHIAGRRAPGLAMLAAALATLGAFAGAAMQGFFRTVIAIRQSELDPATIDSVEEALRSHGPLYLSTQAPTALLPVGLLLFAIPLVRTDRTLIPPAALLAVGAILFPVSRSAGAPLLVVGGDLVLLAATVWLAVLLASRPTLWPEQPG